MNTASKLRYRASLAIIGLLWLNLILIVTRELTGGDTYSFSASIAGLIIVSAATFSWWQDRTGVSTRIITSVAQAATVALLVYCFSGSPLQIDLHMYFFASLAVCAIWIDWRSIVAFALFVALHHTLLYVAMPLRYSPATLTFLGWCSMRLSSSCSRWC